MKQSEQDRVSVPLFALSDTDDGAAHPDGHDDSQTDAFIFTAKMLPSDLCQHQGRHHKVLIGGGGSNS